jgi:hypothetical protein
MEMFIKIAVCCILVVGHISLLVAIARKVGAFCARKKEYTGSCMCGREVFPRALFLAEGLLILVSIFLIEIFFNHL